MMTHRIPFPIRLPLALFLAMVSLIAGAATAGAQQLALTPGAAQVYAGGSGSASPANYAEDLSGLILNGQQQITFDKSGNLYIFDNNSDVVRVVAASTNPIPSLPGITPTKGWVYTVAGDGSLAASASCTTKLDAVGDGCLATQAALRNPTGAVAIDSYGNVFVSAAFERDVRVVYAGGSGNPLGSLITLENPTVTTPQAGFLYDIAGTSQDSGYSGDNGLATSAVMTWPNQVAIDSNENIFIIDKSTSTLRVVYSGAGYVPGLPSGAQKGYIYTIAGSNSSHCNLKTSDCGNGGPATSALFNSPQSVAFDASGNLYIADTTTQVLGAIYFGSGSLPGVSSPTKGNYYIIAGGGTSTPNLVAATSAALDPPTQVAIGADGSIYLSTGNAGYGQAVRVDASGTVYTIFGNPAGANCSTATDTYGDGCPATGMGFGNQGAAGVAVDASGNIYASDPANSLIRESLVASALTLPLAYQLGSAVVPQVVDVYNTGTKALTLSELSASGTGLSIAPTGGATDCTSTTSLAPGETCQIGISFAPTVVGSFPGSVTIGSNSTSGSTTTITLNGTATAQPTVTALQRLVPFQISTGEPVTFTATVSGPAGTTIPPTGTVTFATTGSSPITLATNVPLNGSGVATATVPVTLAAGAYSVTAQYSGDAASLASTYNSAQPLTVSTLQTPLITISAAPSTGITQGSSVTLTATVTPFSGSVIPSGSVTFMVGDVPLVPLSGTNPVALSAGTNGMATATFTTTALPVGTDTPTVYYSGDSNYAPAYGTGSVITVQPATAAQLVFYPSAAGPVSLSSGQPASQQIAIDAYGNLYYNINEAYLGKGTVPGTSNPVAGTVYNLPTGSYPVSKSADVKLDSAGDVYIADSSKSQIVRISAGAGVATLVAGQPGTSKAPVYGSVATATTLNGPQALAIDNEGNIYVADNLTTACCSYYATTIDRIDALTGVITLVAGTAGTTGYTGDGGQALNATINNPTGMAIDINGNLDIADSRSNVVRQINLKTGIITTIAGGSKSCSNGLNASGANGDGAAATDACLNNPQGIFADRFGNLFISESGTHDVREIYPNGTIMTAANNTQVQQTSLPGVAEDTQGNLYLADNQLTEVQRGAGSITFSGSELGAASTVVTNVYNDGNAPLTLSALSFPAGFPQQPSGGTDCATGTTVAVDSAGCAIGIGFFPAAPGNASGAVTITDTAGNATSGANSITLTGTNPATGSGSNSINWTQPLPDVTYGAPPTTLTATSTAGPSYTVTYSVAGPATISAGNTLTITGAGTVSVTAYQFGDPSTSVATAQAVTRTFKVAQAPLTVTANSFSCVYGQVAACLAANPLSYTIDPSQFVNGDKPSVVSGTATLTTTATATSNAGTYPIAFATEGLTAANYSFTYANPAGEITITGNLSQSISWNQTLGTVTYGQAPIQLSGAASASSGLAVTYTVSPQSPATINGTLLTITGAGTVEVIASQPGNADYAQATSINQSFLVQRATLTVTASSQTIAQGVPIPTLTYTFGPFQNNDTTASISGTPVLSTSATSSSGVGNYPITITQGSLSSTNYAFTLNSGTLNIVAGTPQTITFNPLPALTYGMSAVALDATASSGQAVTYTTTGPAKISGSSLVITGAGPITVTAFQPGQGTYSPAVPVTQPATVAQTAITIQINNATRADDTQNPQFTWSYASGLVNGDGQGVIGGTVDLVTAATPSSAPGTYPITADTAVAGLSSPNYTFTYLPGTLTIASGGPAPDYTITASPNTLTMAPGQLQQTTLTLTPTSYFSGTVQVSCGKLPTNMSCVFTPAAFNVDGSGKPVSITLTINTNGASSIVGALSSPGKHGDLYTAAIFWLPGGITGLLIAFNRRRLAKHTRIRQWMFLVVLLTGLAGGMTACGGSSASVNPQYTPPGTYTVAITGAGTSTNLSGTDTHAVNLTVTVQGAQ